MTHLAEPSVGDERSEVLTSLAAGLAMLSATEVTPTEVDEVVPFDAEDVTFDAEATWLDQLVLVQDWLRLDHRLDPFASTATLATRLFDGLGARDHSELYVLDGDSLVLTDAGVDLLRARVERATALRDSFLASVETGSRSAATAEWLTAWDDSLTATVSGRIRAKAEVWSIHDFASRAKSGRLDLSPSYQRGDVWPTADAQLLMESILRGIPLPSIIILRPRSVADAPFEIVDGKQRLTSILRFIGAHPTALESVEAANRQHPGFDLPHLFRTNYPAFRRAWADATGERLTTTLERSYFFPYRLASGASGLSGELAPFAGKYYHEITDEYVHVGGEQVAVRDVFESTTDYKIPVIEYTEATPRQIHEVFSLYNKQGKHLNAEEIRNAVYHELHLMRALSAASGDAPSIRKAAPFLAAVGGDAADISKFLQDAGIASARYRRTKVLSWLMSMLVVESLNERGEPRRLSTASQINAMLDRAQHPGDPLNDPGTINELISLVALGMRAHSESDAWADTFKDGNLGKRWQDLQLVASLTGVCLAGAALGPTVVPVLTENAERIRAVSASEWKRPAKTQTSVQWDYLGRVAVKMLKLLKVDPQRAHEAVHSLSGASSVTALVRAAVESE
ncbi:DUF262 domain-containing protein [Pseudactinotalea terrae]|uniref:DUF262 domain-containing protein n=1 Tax=Pseudactinotalea terrae TaxID=1743262 RepID=UPI00139158B6|nr:DUF262 domain-containing protein [Pseudactinotalea terrae]